VVKYTKFVEWHKLTAVKAAKTWIKNTATQDVYLQGGWEVSRH